VVGLAAGAVVLRLGQELLTVSVDGSFTFASRLADKAGYSVTVDAEPVGDLCTIANGSGTVAAADVVMVAVTCLASDAHLASLSITPGSLTPAFDPTVTIYDVSPFRTYQDSITVTAMPHVAGAVVNIAGLDVEPGTPTEISLSPGAQTIAVRVTAPSGATITYALAVTRAPVVYFKPSNTQKYEDFGIALSISGGTFVVGAPAESSGATGVNGDQNNENAQYSGAAYVFTGAGQSWQQQAYLKASNTDPDDDFGRAVAIDGDTIAVGAEWESSSARGIGGDQTNNDASGSGAVYIFERTGDAWAQTAYLKASNADAGDFFGTSVAIKGDTLVVGAFGESSGSTDPTDNSASGAGAAYVFQRQAGVWTQTAYLKASNPEAGDGFGGAVAIDGAMVVVGAGGEGSSAIGVDGDQTNDDAPGSGAAYVFQLNGGSWTQIAYLKPSNTKAGEGFGGSVAISGDTVVVGAADEDSGSTGVNGDQYAVGNILDIGAVYVFVQQDQSFVQQAFLKAFDTAYYYFGEGVGISGDTVVVAALGTGYTYVRSAGNWAERGALDLFANDISVGTRTAIDGDEVLLTNIFDGSGARGVNPAPTTATAFFSGGVYLFQ
jgi:trimeric autotransporter adhesin